MANLTAAEYEAQSDAAYDKWNTNWQTRVDQGAAWIQISSAYAHLQRHQEDFDNRGLVPSPKALTYRTEAEDALKRAKSKLGAVGISSAIACAASNAAGVAAFQYVHQVRKDNPL